MTDAIIRDLETMADALNYRRWILDVLRGSLGERVLEVGAGIGQFTELFLDRELVVAIDAHSPAVARLMRRFGSRPNVIVAHGDIASDDVLGLDVHRCDTVVCINVLEHVLDDERALANIRALLVEGGHLLLFVPAFQALFGATDRLVGHHRRYEKVELVAKLRRVGFDVVKAHYLNALAPAAWFFNNRVLDRAGESIAMVWVHDRLVVPWLSRLERVVRPPFGLSIVAVGAKR